MPDFEALIAANYDNAELGEMRKDADVDYFYALLSSAVGNMIESGSQLAVLAEVMEMITADLWDAVGGEL